MYLDNRSIQIDNIFYNYIKSNKIDDYIKIILTSIDFNNDNDIATNIIKIKKKINKGRIPYEDLMNITYFYENKNDNHINTKYHFQIYPDESKIINEDNIPSLRLLKKQFKKNISKMIDKNLLLFLNNNKIENIKMFVEFIN